MANEGEHPDELHNMRHSAAHLVAAAVQKLWPDVKLGVGPVIKDGFYYDFDLSHSITPEDLTKIEETMRELQVRGDEYVREDITLEDAKKRLADMQQPYKVELVETIEKTGSTTVSDSESDTEGKGQKEEVKSVSLYTTGDFVDLCRGGHVEKTTDIGPFKLLSVAGAYWRGKEGNPQMQRIYGTAWATQADLDTYLSNIEEAKKRDHRKIGRELDLFTFSDLVGSGLPLFTPKGTIIRSLLIEFSESLQQKHGFQKVWIPHITKTDLYKTSGHWDKFGKELFLVKSQETDTEFVMKPMNCPHHTQIYASRPRSYRELPLRYMETTTCYRDEKAGELAGLSRVRSLNQDDAHIFCTMEQVEAEFVAIMEMIKELYGRLGMTFRARLSFRDVGQPEKYLGDTSNWDQAEKIIEEITKKLDLPYDIALGEAAFYGPKIDIMVMDALGREWQCATEQLDFVQPARFGLTYTDRDGTQQTPVMIHKALLGSVERFMAVYIEHTAGAFPLWLAPVQLKILPIADRHIEYAGSIMKQFQEHGFRVEVDDSSESVGKKIRNAQLEKVPYMLVVGDKEQEAGTIAVRTRAGEDLGALTVETLLDRVKTERDE